MFYLFVITGGFLLLFELLSGLLLSFHRDDPPRSSPAVSVLIPAMNEREQLRKNIPFILEAMNEGDELIVVDDGSSDGSYELLKGMSVEAPIVLIRNFLSQGKKRSVQIACEKATHPYILQTDADCTPRSPEWIDRMRGPLVEQVELVLGWGAMEGGKGLLSALYHYDTARTAMNYSLWAKMGMPYMGVGRNLLYKRALRTREPMPEAYHRTMSGDDDLLVNQRGKNAKTRCAIHPNAHTITPSLSSWQEHWTRSRRHAQAGLYYSLNTLIPLGLLRAAELLFPIATLLLLLTGEVSIALFGYLGVMLLRSITMLLVARSLITGLIAIGTPVLSFISTMNRTFVEVSVLVSKPTRWR